MPRGGSVGLSDFPPAHFCHPDKDRSAELWRWGFKIWTLQSTPAVPRGASPLSASCLGGKMYEHPAELLHLTTELLLTPTHQVSDQHQQRSFPEKSKRSDKTENAQFVLTKISTEPYFSTLSWDKIRRHLFVLRQKAKNLPLIHFLWVWTQFWKPSILHVHLAGTFFPASMKRYSRQVNVVPFFYFHCNLERIKWWFGAVRGASDVQCSFMQPWDL